MNIDFNNRVDLQREANLAKWGRQDIPKLLLVCQEQLGQVTSEYLGNGVTDKFRIEIVHLAAVLPTLYEQTVLPKEREHA